MNSSGVEDDATGYEINLSNEHKEMKWVKYEEATKLLNWDSNKTALWELYKRLNAGDISNNGIWM